MDNPYKKVYKDLDGNVVRPPKPKVKGQRHKKPLKTKRIRKAQAVTVVEKELIEQQNNLTVAKRNQTRAKNKITNLLKGEEEPSEILEGAQKTLEEEAIQDPNNFEAGSNKKVLFRPNPGPQSDFLAAAEDEVFYGGSRGGGKTYSLIMDPLRYCGMANFTGLLVRRTMVELRDIVQTTKKIYPEVFPGARYLKQENVWEFPSGARLYFGYAENVDDAERYRGQQYHWLGMDELPQYPTPDVYNLIKSSVRSTDPNIPTMIRSTGNPGNAGSWWVKEWFIDPAIPNTTFTVDVEFTNPVTGERKKTVITRKFIPATVWDNPFLLQDENYVASLASLPEVQRRQMLEGDWDVLEGMAFPEFKRKHHVVEAFDIPHDWVKFRSADWGFASPFCVLWFAVDYDNNIYIYREYYGHHVLADTWAQNVCAMEKNERVEYGIIDGSTAAKRGDRGPSIYEAIVKEMQKHGKQGFRFADRSPGSRAAGKLEVHRRLALRDTAQEEMKPTLFIFDTCVNLIRTLPMLPLDANDPEKVDTKAEDHAFDALHYGLRSRPATPFMMYDLQRTHPEFKAADPVFGY